MWMMLDVKRTVEITGYCELLKKLVRKERSIRHQVAAVSVELIQEQPFWI